jgi:phospholipase C
MDGFARISPDALKYYDGSFLPFYYGLANTFPIADRWFCSCQGQTHPNRRYLQAATSVGLVETDVSKVLSTPDAPNGTIWDRLNAHAISWVDYAYDLPDIALFPRVLLGNAGRVKPISQFLFDCQYGRLPQVSIVSPGDTAFSEEPEKDIQLGEAYSAMLINAVLQSPTWDKTVMFFCYDEHGGFYDHVPPPAAVPPDNIPPQIDVAKGDSPGGFDRYGVRVPGFVISPFAKADYVSHVVHDHTSILRFIETKFNLGALTYRDANADNLMDSIDFEAKAFLEPPTLPAPADPTGYSTFQSSPGLPGPTAGLHPAALS